MLIINYKWFNVNLIEFNLSDGVMENSDIDIVMEFISVEVFSLIFLCNVMNLYFGLLIV